MDQNIGRVEVLNSLFGLQQLVYRYLQLSLPAGLSQQRKQTLVCRKPLIDDGSFLTYILSEIKPQLLQVRRLISYRNGFVFVGRSFISAALNAVERLLSDIRAVGLGANIHDLLSPSAGAQFLQLQSVNESIRLGNDYCLIVLWLPVHIK